MARAEVSTTIDRPIEQVFAALTRFADQPKWSTVTLEAEQTSPGPLGIGSTARYVAKFLGRRFEGEIEITEYEPNHKLSDISTAGPIPMRSTITVEPSDGGTRLDAVVDLEPGGFFKIAEPLVVAMASRQLHADLSNFKDLLEADAI